MKDRRGEERHTALKRDPIGVRGDGGMQAIGAEGAGYRERRGAKTSFIGYCILISVQR